MTLKARYNASGVTAEGVVSRTAAPYLGGSIPCCPRLSTCSQGFDPGGDVTPPIILSSAVAIVMNACSIRFGGAFRRPRAGALR